MQVSQTEIRNCEPKHDPASKALVLVKIVQKRCKVCNPQLMQLPRTEIRNCEPKCDPSSKALVLVRTPPQTHPQTRISSPAGRMHVESVSNICISAPCANMPFRPITSTMKGKSVMHK